MNAHTPDTAVAESPLVAAAEARAVAPARVGALEAVARSRLLKVGMDALLAEVATLLSNARISVVVSEGERSRIPKIRPVMHP